MVTPTYVKKSDERKPTQSIFQDITRSQRYHLRFFVMGKWVRINGLQPPYSTEQILILLFYSTSIAVIFTIETLLFLNRLLFQCYTISIFFTLSRSSAFLFGGINLIFVVVMFWCWFFVSYLDPNEESKMKSCSAICFSSETLSTPRYCPVCCKIIKGLDHHCVWLNTCIGARTYPSFLILIQSCSIQLLFQVTSIIKFTTNSKLNSSLILVFGWLLTLCRSLICK